LRPNNRVIPRKKGILLVPSEPIARHSGAHRFAAVALIAVIAVAGVFVVATGLHRELSFATLIRHRAAINAVVADHRSAAFAGFVALYVAVVSLSIPGAFILTVTGGLVFGAVLGGLGAFLGATTGAAFVFLITRSALGGWLVRRAGPFAELVADGFRRDAFNYLLFLRLVPLFPFWIVNIAPAVLGVRLASFIAATAIGIIPLTSAFALFGAGLDSAIAVQAPVYEACLAAGRQDCRIDFDVYAALTPELIGALAVLAVVALIPVALRRWKAARERDFM
jgi:uncharacterized membrane protein YdjX (TVP38/TMEM64 family)